MYNEQYISICHKFMMETRDSFFVYLNSTFNKNEFPNNKFSGFTNVIKPTISLDSDYEVSIENLIFNPSLYMIPKHDRNYLIQIGISYEKEDGRRGGYTLNYTPENFINAENIYQLISHLNNDLVSFLVRNNVIRKDQPYIFKLKESSSFIDFHELKLKTLYNSTRITWNIAYKLSQILGIRENAFISKPNSLKPTCFPKKTNCFHIYSDLVEPSNVGSQSIHLMDIYPLPHMYTKQSTFSFSKRVNKRFIDQISIRITDEEGNNPPLVEDVSVLIVLHFKRTI